MPTKSAEKSRGVLMDLGKIQQKGLTHLEGKVLKKQKNDKEVKQVNGKGLVNDYWGQLKGWRPVESQDLLLGAEEGGFAGLEILNDPMLIDPSMLPSKSTNPGAKKEGRTRKTPSGNTKNMTVGSAGPAGDQEIAELRKRVKALEQENKRLQKKGTAKADPPLVLAPKSSDHLLPLTDSGKVAVQAVQDSSNPELPDGSQSMTDISNRQRNKLALRAKREERKLRKAELRAKREKQQQQCSISQQEGGDGMTAQRAGHQDMVVDTSAWRPFSLQPSIERALVMKGFQRPSEIQRACLPAAVRDQMDIIGAAQTGSGKTLAFGIPVFQVLLQEREVLQASGEQQADPHAGKLRALILAPTRELALQVSQHLQAIGKECGVRVVAIVGGLAQVKQERLLRGLPEVVVATPGRLWELMREGHSHLTDLSHLSFLVLDEADKMVQQGHFQELNGILDLVPHPGEAKKETYDADFEEAFQQDIQRDREDVTGDEEAIMDEGEVGPGVSGQVPEEKTIRGDKRKGHQHVLQTFVFSATLTLPGDKRKRLRKGGGGAGGGASLENLMDRIVFRGEPTIVDLTTTGRLASKVEEAQVHCTDSERDEVLYYLIAKHPGRTLVFVNAISSVRRVAAILKILGIPAHALHAQQQQRQRLKSVDRFKNDEQAVLVATDVAARGLDIKGVRCVIHYQLPATVDTYIHRCGRTARAGEDGLSLALITPRESPRWTALMKALGREQSMVTFPIDRTLMPQVHRRVKLAIQLDDILRAERKKHAEDAWARSNAEAVGIDLSDSEGAGEDTEDHVQASSTAAKSIQLQLAHLLSAPLVPKISTKFLTGGAVAQIAHGSGLEATATASTSHVAVPAETVSKAVALANVLQKSKDAVLAQQKKGRAQRKPAENNKRQLRNWKSSSQLARDMLKKKEQRKSNKRKLVVIPASFGRDAMGTDALSALRRKIAAI
ncbi:hypothetical protein CEUSTIGMA_g1347.t1 [Chlamydomonas eustigma]|uniref:ATP-dependent RNA helicase n=1 Tax=Chlamydomonas eustigma TaxID=1157962 RepID=A0A250WST1_9CHLO|nr:hypothetical protein CEUSTIGMA_g1347.t1 [Chlamydomonas eustigma]|eukprot:GAX73897.1 hypothetical protein CEUSTIGMA_g1347.t1 [Chlamydomonas eustigma]